MPIYNAMNNLKASIPRSAEAAQVFLNTLSSNVQEQLISAIYLGREHINSIKLRDDVEINRSYIDHVNKNEYAQIIYEKGDNVITYLDKLVECAKASGVDLKTL